MLDRSDINQGNTVRGDMENRITENQSELCADRTICRGPNAEIS